MTTEEALAVLRLKPGADRKAVDRSYRRLAKKLHPDVGGDPAAFMRVKEAYDLLCGRERIPPDKDRQAALAILSEALAQVVRQAVESGRPVKETDLVAAVKTGLSNCLAEHRKLLRRWEQLRDGLAAAAGRFAGQGELPGLLDEMLAARSAEAEQAASRERELVARIEKAHTLLDGVTFRFDREDLNRTFGWMSRGTPAFITGIL